MRESEKYQRTSKTDQRINATSKKNFVFARSEHSLMLSLAVDKEMSILYKTIRCLQIMCDNLLLMYFRSPEYLCCQAMSRCRSTQ